MTGSAVDDAIVRRYLDGECYLLAALLSRRTGWSLVMWSPDDGASGHVMARTEDGRYVDILGVHTLDEMLASGWHLSDEIEVTEAELARLWGVTIDIDDETSMVADMLLAALRGEQA